ncbi:MAG TPA: hypothetical protein VMZ50_08435 [Phycisphaerae bacterium]|nr:hypothetical protein [Phycisphaerae bacterium]
MSLRACWKCKGAGGKPRCWCDRCSGTGRVRDPEAGDHAVFASALAVRAKMGGGEPVRWEVEARGGRWVQDVTVRSLTSGQRQTVEASRLVVVRTVEERLADELMGAGR